jgi:hypothetical protein
VILLSLGLIAYGLSWPDRTNLINALLILWVVAYGLPYVVATIRFRRIIQSCALDVVERRRGTRTSGSHPVVTGPPPASEPPASGVEIGPTE